MDSMDSNTASALATFLMSLTQLAESYSDAQLTISVLDGSVVAGMTTNDEIKGEILDIVDNRSQDNSRIGIIKEIQDRIKENGLTYSVYFAKEVKQPVLDLTKSFKGRNFSLRRPRRGEWDEQVVFIKGNVHLAGGTSTNLHIKTENDEKYTVWCSRDEATNLTKNGVYGDICISALRKCREGDSDRYDFIDSYFSDESYHEYLSLYNITSKGQGLGKFELLHNKIKTHYNKQELLRIIKVMKLFNHVQANRGLVRSILMSVSPIKDAHEEVRNLYDSMVTILKQES